ncbi:MAG TPA: polysaccharide biosynthesis/export family protein [Parvibaculum sp.]|uniref:polysaccharide biosynthesis/export family protein n=1 Tax=Parvibaculum sp. TaxID=2024848 RepID=UPI002C195B90|nr:polysaccharide biosynthesis/export family protein [Parvibaculum sp.]HMM13536.1 polysaccharide biosynthesis/export family protein [Parvibaculum sp.]
MARRGVLPFIRDQRFPAGKFGRLIAAGLMCLAVSLALSACAGGNSVTERPINEAVEPYLLDSGDKLRVTVFGQSDLSGDFSVDGGGNIAIPLIPPVRARGLTTDGLQAAIEESLGKTLLRNPNVSVQIMEFRPFFILGEVQRAGQYPFVNGMTVQSAVAIAGGFSYRANQDTVHITRKRGDRLMEMDVDTGAPVRPGDTILVKERYF